MSFCISIQGKALDVEQWRNASVTEFCIFSYELSINNVDIQWESTKLSHTDICGKSKKIAQSFKCEIKWKKNLVYSIPFPHWVLFPIQTNPRIRLVDVIISLYYTDIRMSQMNHFQTNKIPTLSQLWTNTMNILVLPTQFEPILSQHTTHR